MERADKLRLRHARPVTRDAREQLRRHGARLPAEEAGERGEIVRRLHRQHPARCGGEEGIRSHPADGGCCSIRPTSRLGAMFAGADAVVHAGRAITSPDTRSRRSRRRAAWQSQRPSRCRRRCRGRREHLSIAAAHRPRMWRSRSSRRAPAGLSPWPRHSSTARRAPRLGKHRRRLAPHRRRARAGRTRAAPPPPAHAARGRARHGPDDGCGTPFTALTAAPAGRRRRPPPPPHSKPCATSGPSKPAALSAREEMAEVDDALARRAPRRHPRPCPWHGP